MTILKIIDLIANNHWNKAKSMWVIKICKLRHEANHSEVLLLQK